jgi:uncharacterized Fe-S cluster-containing radical SAM superfamily protein
MELEARAGSCQRSLTASLAGCLLYCGYCNGLIGYVQEVAGRTEAFWCPIKHAARVGAHHSYYAQFVDYGDAEGFDEGLEASRALVTRPGLSGIKAGE